MPSTQFNLRRYVIKDGRIDDLPAIHSRDTGKDITALLRYAGKEHPSDRLALIITSHGDGNWGLRGDNGELSMPDLADAIKDGLTGSGHDKLNLIDFDSCKMAQVGVAQRMAPLATDMVASPQIVWANLFAYGADFQNLNAWISDLINKPNMSGEQLGETIIAEANRGSNTDKTRFKEEGTPTLAHFNLKRFSVFQKSFQKFGQALAIAVDDKTNRQLMQSIISRVPGYASDGKELSGCGLTDIRDRQHALGTSVRDLDTFAYLIQSEVKAGSLHDKSGALKSAADELRASQSQLEQSWHLVFPNKEQPLRGSDWPSHGLNVYLPAPIYFNPGASGQKQRTSVNECPASGNATKTNKDNTDEQRINAIISGAFHRELESQEPGWKEFWGKLR